MQGRSKTFLRGYKHKENGDQTDSYGSWSFFLKHWGIELATQLDTHDKGSFWLLFQILWNHRTKWTKRDGRRIKRDAIWS